MHYGRDRGGCQVGRIMLATRERSEPRGAYMPLVSVVQAAHLAAPLRQPERSLDVVPISASVGIADRPNQYPTLAAICQPLRGCPIGGAVRV